MKLNLPAIIAIVICLIYFYCSKSNEKSEQCANWIRMENSYDSTYSDTVIIINNELLKDYKYIRLKFIPKSGECLNIYYRGYIDTIIKIN